MRGEGGRWLDTVAGEEEGKSLACACTQRDGGESKGRSLGPPFGGSVGRPLELLSKDEEERWVGKRVQRTGIRNRLLLLLLLLRRGFRAESEGGRLSGKDECPLLPPLPPLLGGGQAMPTAGNGGEKRTSTPAHTTNIHTPKKEGGEILL